MVILLINMNQLEFVGVKKTREKRLLFGGSHLGFYKFATPVNSTRFLIIEVKNHLHFFSNCDYMTLIA